MAFAGGPMAFSSRPAVLRHAKPLAVARPEARLAGLVAALVVTFSGSLQPALAGNFLQDAVEKKAAEIQANIQKVRRSRVEPPVYMSAKPPHPHPHHRPTFKSDLPRPSRTRPALRPHCRTRPRQPKTDPRSMSSRPTSLRMSMPTARAASTSRSTPRRSRRRRQAASPSSRLGLA